MKSASELSLFLMENTVCVDCRAEQLSQQKNTLKCNKCGREYSQNQNPLNFVPVSSFPEKIPKIYLDEHYLYYANKMMDRQIYNKENIAIRLTEGLAHKKVAAILKKIEPKVILDIGCGVGGLLSYTNDYSKNYLGIDIDEKCLKVFRQEYPTYKLLQGSAYQLPFQDSCFDCIVSTSTLEHILYLDESLEEIDRITTDNSNVIISVPNEGGLAWGLGRQISTARKYKNEPFSYIRSNQIQHVNCIWQVEKTLRRYFKIVDRILTPFRIPNYHLNLMTTFHCKKR